MNGQTRKHKILLALIFLALTGIPTIGLADSGALLADCPGTNGTISVDTTWSADCTLFGPTTVDAGVTLTVNPGVTVAHRGGSFTARSLIVNGTLIADGTAADPIVFTSNQITPAKSDWVGIIFNPSSTGSVLDYVTVEYAGYAGAAVKINSNSTTITNSTIQHNSGEGIRMTNASPTISSTHFNDNSDSAIRLQEASFPSLSGLSASGNGFDGVMVVMAGQSINTDYTWGNGGLSSYRFGEGVTVDEGVTLTVAPGTTVGQRGGSFSERKLIVNGTLIADGTAADPIIFTSGADTPAKSDWVGIIFNPSSTGSVLDYTTVEYTGYSGAAVKINSSSVAVTNSAIQHNAHEGMSITNASPTINNTSFNDNNESAMRLQEASFPSLSGLSASGNGFDGVLVVMAGQSIANDYTWGNGGLSNYRFGEGVTVDEGVTLTVAPGTTVGQRGGSFSERKLIVNGTLIADGTAADPIIFTSGADTPAKSDWVGIIFNPSSTGSVLDYVTVEYAGYAGAAVKISSSSTTITNSIIRLNSSGGISVKSGTPSITQNNIVQNDRFGLLNENEATTVSATCNWWGSASGPTHDSNPGGTGQEVSDGVIYDPWLVETAPGGDCSGGNPMEYVYLPVVIK